MEDRTQIRFSNPDIDGSPIPQLITLEQEAPIEGQTTKDDGTSFIWHKWLCTGSQYFMASDTLDAMLKVMPDKVGKPLKIEKVENPKGGFPFFQINGMNKDELVQQAPQTATPVMPPQMATAPASNTDGELARLEQKLDQVIQMTTLLLSRTPAEPEEAIPF
jgi:hypothetical protein